MEKKVFALLSIMLICPKSTLAQTQKEIESNPYNFLMFENFELTKRVYQNESKLVSKLQTLREILVDKLDATQKLMDILSDKNLKLTSDTWKVLPEIQNSLEKMRTALEELSAEFPNELDNEGATGGIVRLFFTYNFNLTAISEHQLVEYKDPYGIPQSFSSYEKLTAIDFAWLAKKAADSHLLGPAIDLVKECTRLIPLEENMSFQMIPGMVQEMLDLKRLLIKLNNQYLVKKQRSKDKDMILKPYLVNEKLERKSKQPKFVKNLEEYSRKDKLEKLLDESYFTTICRDGTVEGKKMGKPGLKCRFLHHQDPYLKLGPFKEDQASNRPYAVVFRDILTENELEFLVAYARPRLSRTRVNNLDFTPSQFEHEFRNGNKRKVVHKTVQTWLAEVEFPADYSNYVGKKYGKIILPKMWKLAKKIQLATQLRTDGQYSATPIQVTNYGLGGLCEAHIDPHGYLEGADLPESRKTLVQTGDMIGTFMAWLTDVEAGGGTAYLDRSNNGLLMPERGSAAFWYDLMSDGRRDVTTRHGGCPILKGSKWILNKWMYSFDNFNTFPCSLNQTDAIPEPNVSHYFL